MWISGAWVRASVSSKATYSGANLAGPTMFLKTGISGARPGATASIQWQPYGVFVASGGAVVIVSSLHYTTDGSDPVAGSTQLVAMRTYAPGAGSVVSASGGATTLPVPASGKLNVGLYLPASMLYGADGGTLSINVSN